MCTRMMRVREHEALISYERVRWLRHRRAVGIATALHFRDHVTICSSDVLHGSITYLTCTARTILCTRIYRAFCEISLEYISMRHASFSPQRNSKTGSR